MTQLNKKPNYRVAFLMTGVFVVQHNKGNDEWETIEEFGPGEEGLNKATARRNELLKQ